MVDDDDGVDGDAEDGFVSCAVSGLELARSVLATARVSTCLAAIDCCECLTAPRTLKRWPPPLLMLFADNEIT